MYHYSVWYGYCTVDVHVVPAGLYMYHLYSNVLYRVDVVPAAAQQRLIENDVFINKVMP